MDAPGELLFSDVISLSLNSHASGSFKSFHRSQSHYSLSQTSRKSKRSDAYSIKEGQEVRIDIPVTQSIMLDKKSNELPAWRLCTIKAFSFMTLQYLLQSYLQAYVLNREWSKSFM